MRKHATSVTKLYKRFPKHRRSRRFRGTFEIKSAFCHSSTHCLDALLTLKEGPRAYRQLRSGCPKPTVLEPPANPQMHVQGPFEKQQEGTSAWPACRAIRDLRPHLETQVSLPGPAGDQTGGILHTPAAGVLPAFFWESAETGDWVGRGRRGAGWPATARVPGSGLP